VATFGATGYLRRYLATFEPRLRRYLATFEPRLRRYAHLLVRAAILAASLEQIKSRPQFYPWTAFGELLGLGLRLTVCNLLKRRSTMQ
jgi:hypothetical protein